MDKALVVWPPKKSIREYLPEIFLKSDYGKFCAIIDCWEVFIERPKSFSTQAATWSDYKQRNTWKFLIGITLTGFISFLSSCYGDRASDKFITRYSRFYDLLERDDEVMPDRSSKIQQDLLFHFCRLIVPPGATVENQMTKSEVKKTKELETLR